MNKRTVHTAGTTTHRFLKHIIVAEAKSNAKKLHPHSASDGAEWHARMHPVCMPYQFEDIIVIAFNEKRWCKRRSLVGDQTSILFSHAGNNRHAFENTTSSRIVFTRYFYDENVFARLHLIT